MPIYDVYSCFFLLRGIAGYLIKLVSLILLGWELRVLYHCTVCTRYPDLSLDVYAIPIFYITLYTVLLHVHVHTDWYKSLMCVSVCLYVLSSPPLPHPVELQSVMYGVSGSSGLTALKTECMK